MDTSRKIDITVEMTTATAEGTHKCTPAEWRTRSRVNAPGYGKADPVNLAAYVARFEASTQKEGVNSHLGETVVMSAFIKDQRSGDILAVYRGPLFVAF